MSLPEERTVADHGRYPKIAMVIVRPLPGERRKSPSLVLVERAWRSKWSRALCMGDATACQAGSCRHATTVAGLVVRCRPAAREMTLRGGG